PIGHWNVLRAVALVHLLMKGHRAAHVLVIAMKPHEPANAAFQKKPLHETSSGGSRSLLVRILLDQAPAPVVAHVPDVDGIQPIGFLAEADVIAKDRPVATIVI